MKTISVLGCGWYGLPLATELLSKGFKVKGSVTNSKKLPALAEAGVESFIVHFDGSQCQFDPGFFSCDLIIICIPPNTKKGEAKAFPSKIRQIIQAINKYKVQKVIFISSTGIYGNRNQVVNELTEPRPDDESGEVLLEAENLFTQQNCFKTTTIRFAGLIGPGREPGRFFAGRKNIPNGRAPVNLIHLDDCIGISISIIEKDLFGFIINAASPGHPIRSEYYTKAAIEIGFTPPGFIDELLNWKIVESVILGQSIKYNFLYPEL